VPNKKISALNDFAKTDAVAKAKTDAKFFVVSDADVVGKDKDGNIVLSKNADIAVIRKEDLAESGYGEEGGDTDDAANMSVGEGESQWPEADEAKAHVQALDKCRGMIMKGAGLADEDVYGDPNNESGEMNDMDEAVKAVRAGDLAKAQAAIAKRDARRAAGNGAVSKATIEKMLNDKFEDLAKALEARIAGGEKVIQPRQGAAGAVIEKGKTENTSDGTAEGDLKKMAADLRASIETLKQERTSFLEKANNKIALTDQENLRKGKVSNEIMRAETALAELYKQAAAAGVRV
jgi:hypothetical protein